MYSSTHEMYYLQHAEIDLVKRGKVHQTGSLPISDDDSGCAVLDEYAWVPPGLTPKQVKWSASYLALNSYCNSA